MICIALVQSTNQLKLKTTDSVKQSFSLIERFGQIQFFVTMKNAYMIVTVGSKSSVLPKTVI